MVSCNIHDLVLKFILFFVVVVPLSFLLLHSIYSFVSHSQLIIDTPLISCLHVLESDSTELMYWIAKCD